MKNIVIIWVVCLSFSAKAQQWIKDGAEWHYITTNEGLSSYHHFLYVGDSVVDGYSWQMVADSVWNYFPTNPQNDYLSVFDHTAYDFYRMSADTLFKLRVYQDTTISDNIVFIFQAGATWLVQGDAMNENCTGLTKDSIAFYSTEQVNGIQHQFYDRYFIDATTNEVNGSSRVSSRYGGIGYGELLFDAVCQPWMPNSLIVSGTLLCYQDNEGFSIKNTTHDCDYYSTLSTTTLAFNSVRVFPNPVKDFLTIQLDENPENFTQWKILQLDGSLLKSGKITQAVTKLSVSDLNAGVYFVEIENAEGQRFVQKINK